MSESIFGELSLVIVVTGIISVLMKLIRQPLILGYIISGLVVGPSLLGLIHSKEVFEAFSSLGIALLLFIIGLGMNVTELKKLGQVSGIIASASLFIVTSLGYLAGSAMGFSKKESLIIGLSLFFSSTIIIIKILSDKKEQNRLYGQIAIGVILVEDIIATLALLFIAAGKGDGVSIEHLAPLLGKGCLLIAFLIFCSKYVLPRVSRFMASTQELLFLFATAWGFGVASLFDLSGFSIEIGALFGGVALASSPYVQEISARLRPLRDFFIVLFFITLGESMNLTHISSSILPAIVLSLVVVIAKPLVVTTALGLLGYTKRVSFKAGINLSQISEFSIILAVLAINEGMARPELGSTITLVAIITIAASTYMTHYDEKLFAYFDRIKFHIFEKDPTFHEQRSPQPYQLVVFGYHHGGHEFIRTFREMHRRFLVIDYDPGVIDLLDHQRINYLYGDATDTELLREANIEKAKLIVSTITDHETNMFLTRTLEELNPDAAVICHADNIRQAKDLYEAGASYVMIPHHIGSERMSAFIKKTGIHKEEFRKYRKKHLAYLESHLSSTVI